MLLLVLLIAALADPQPKILVYVALPERDGFVDAGKALSDSQRDLQREINKRKHLRIVATRAEADVVVTVIDRGIMSEDTGGLVFVPIGRAVLARPTRRSWNALQARLDAGGYSKLLTGQFSGIGDVWEECAEQVAKELDGWAATNRERLILARSTKR